MEILQFLINYFLDEYGHKELKPLLSMLKENNFDIKSVIKNLSPEKVAPLIKEFLSEKNKGPLYKEQTYNLKPISNIADKEIIYTLNKYFSE